VKRVIERHYQVSAVDADENASDVNVFDSFGEAANACTAGHILEEVTVTRNHADGREIDRRFRTVLAVGCRRDAKTVPLAPLDLQVWPLGREVDVSGTPAATAEELAAPHVPDFNDDDEVTVPYAATPIR